jgi:hypothetical protein
MKKYLVLLSVIAVLALTVTAFAATQVDITGDIRVRGEINNNLSDFNSDSSARDGNQFYDQRVRLNVKATVTPNTFGVIELESISPTDYADTCIDYNTGKEVSCENDDVSYDSHYEVKRNKDGFTWGGGSDSKRGAMYIRQAYISHSFGKTATLQVGHMLLSLGNKLFFDHTKFGDDAILLTMPAGDGNLMLLSIKHTENFTSQNDDTDVYVVGYGTPIGSANISADLSYVTDHQKGVNLVDSDGNGWSTEGVSLWNLGLRGNADLSGIKVKADVELQTGKVRDYSEDAGVTTDDIKFKGYALMAGAEIPAGPATVRVNAAYGSGDKDDTSDKMEDFKNFLGDNQNYTYVYEYKTKAASGSQHTGLANTWYINAGVTAKPMTDLTLSGDLYYLRAAQEVAINGATDANGDSEKSKDLGVEIDAKLEYQIDTNLVYFVEAGYLFAGKAFDTPNLDDAGYVIDGDNNGSDNPYSIRQGLQLKF